MSAKAPDPFDALVGRNIRIQRTVKGMSQTELGSRLGVSFQQVQKYEKGTNRVGSGRLFRIADVLGVCVTLFFLGIRDLHQQPESQPGARRSADPQPFRLIQAFVEIKNDAVRRSILTLVEKVAAVSR